ncbi:MAG: TIGR03943 family protein [Actinomycetota bacterium]|nr:TIGR03943 family protein [Actinomycetota bacterium]
MRRELELPVVEAPVLLEARRMWSPGRVAGAVVLAGWASLFWFLIFSGRESLYLGARTRWLIPVGAVVLSVAAAGRIVAARVSVAEPLSRSQAWRAALLLLPLVIVVALPPAALGSFALDRRSDLIGGGFAGSADVSRGPITLIDVASALGSPAAMRSLVRRAGSRVTFMGFVSRTPGMAADQFELTRFVITCCVADALSVQVHVVDAPPGRFSPNDWVEVTGNLYPLNNEVLVAASSVIPITRPTHPYLSP